MLFCELDTSKAIFGHNDLKAVNLQRLAYEHPHLLRVIDDEHFSGSTSRRRMALRCGAGQAHAGENVWKLAKTGTRYGRK